MCHTLIMQGVLNRLGWCYRNEGVQIAVPSSTLVYFLFQIYISVFDEYLITRELFIINVMTNTRQY